jgi:NTE family protein
MSIAAHNWPSIGLVLSGGGARGLAHIGVLRVLEREGIPVDFLVGTSMGGLIAAGYAAGMSSYDMEQEARIVTQKRKLVRMVDPGLPRGGLLHGQRVCAFFKHLFGEKTFTELELPLAVVAVDLITHQEVVLDSGSVAMALRATTSLPGLFIPLEMNGMRLTDGGVLNNLPVDVARKMGAERVIAVDIGMRDQQGIGRWMGNRRWIPESISDTLAVMDDTLYTLRIAEQEHKLDQYPPDLLIYPDIPKNINVIAGYGRVAELIASGERAAKEHLPELESLLHQNRHSPICKEREDAKKGIVHG